MSAVVVRATKRKFSGPCFIAWEHHLDGFKGNLMGRIPGQVGASAPQRVGVAGVAGVQHCLATFAF